MHRFFVEPGAVQHNRALLRGEVVHQIRDVLRMHPGNEIVLLDNTGMAYHVELTMVERDAVRGRVLQSASANTEPTTKITLYQALLKGQKFDWVVQKGTEVGITAFVPVLCSRCVMGSAEDVGRTRLERWQKIITEAAEQSSRAVLPKLGEVMVLADACHEAGRDGLSLIPWEEERTMGLREALKRDPMSEQVNIFIGPEGGLTEQEIHTAQAAGIIPVSLGRLTLRAETAGLVAATAILYERNDLG